MNFIKQGFKHYLYRLEFDKQLLPSMYKNSFVSSFSIGIGLSFATCNEKYHHYPLCIITPNIYIGYQCFKHINSIRPPPPLT